METGATRIARLRAAGAGRPRLAAFLGVFSATLLCFLAIGAVLPILPRYVKGPVGAGDLAVGIVVGAFAFSALLGRPIGGRLADLHGRKAVHSWGMTICIGAGLLLFLPLGVPGLVLARLVVGLGDGWVFTAGVTWIVDLAPVDRRGRVIGLFGLAIWGGLTIGAVLGQAVYELGGFDAVWAFAALSPLAGLLLARLVPEGVPHAQPVDEEVADAELGVSTLDATRVTAVGPPPAAGRLARWIPREAVRPGLALAMANVGFGTISGFVVLLLDRRGIEQGATAFTVFAASVVVTRLALGHLPDRLGARRTALGAGIVQAAGLAAIGAAPTLATALLACALMGTGMSLLFPSLALLVVGRVDETRRGAAMGAFTAFFDIGVGLGAPFAGLVASLGGGENYALAFYVSAAVCLAGALLGYRSTKGLVAAPARA